MAGVNLGMAMTHAPDAHAAAGGWHRISHSHRTAAGAAAGWHTTHAMHSAPAIATSAAAASSTAAASSAAVTSSTSAAVASSASATATYLSSPLGLETLGFLFCALILALAVHAIVRQYRDPVHHQPLATLIATLSLTASTLVPLALLLDVRAASAGEVALDEVHLPLSELELAFDALHTALLLLGCLAIPLAYFYIEEDDAAVTDFELEGRSCTSKMLGALRRTLLLIGVPALLLIGLLGARDPPGAAPTAADDGVYGSLFRGLSGACARLLDGPERARVLAEARSAALALLAVGATAVWAVYAGAGVVLLPLRLCAPHLRADGRSGRQVRTPTALHN